MKRSFSLYMVLFFASIAFAMDANAQLTLKVMSFNVRSFEPDFNVVPYAEYLAGENLDIICLNEVENRSSRQVVANQYRDVVYDLANHLNMFAIFGYSYSLANKKGEYPVDNYRFDKNELYGNAILSKYPIINSYSYLLPRPKESADQRSVLIVELLLPNSKIIQVAVTHLDHIGGQLEQAQKLINIKEFNHDYPKLLLGDFNKQPTFPSIEVVKSKFDMLYVGGTWNIDYVWGSKGDWKVLSSKAMDRFYDSNNGKRIELSDHMPVVAEVQCLK